MGEVNETYMQIKQNIVTNPWVDEDEKHRAVEEVFGDMSIEVRMYAHLEIALYCFRENRVLEETAAASKKVVIVNQQVIPKSTTPPRVIKKITLDEFRACQKQKMNVTPTKRKKIRARGSVRKNNAKWTKHYKKRKN